MEQYEEADQEFDSIIQDHAGTEYYLKAWNEKAYTQWAYLDRYQAAAETMLSFVRLYPADSNAPDFLFEAGRIYERGEMFQMAIETWERIINEYPNYSESYRSLFLAGITRYRLNDFVGAQNSFQRCLVLATTSTDQAAASFWVGKTQQMQNDTTTARTSWETTAQIDPTGYYSERAKHLLTDQEPLTASPSYDLGYDLASERLEAENWLIKTFNLPSDINLSSPGNISADLHYLRAHEFHELGLYGEASREMSSLIAGVESDPAELFRLLARCLKWDCIELPSPPAAILDLAKRMIRLP